MFVAGCDRLNPIASKLPRLAGALNLTPLSFDRLVGWARAAHARVFASFLRSCNKTVRQNKRGQLVSGAEVGKTVDLQRVCQKALKENVGTSSRKGRLFFERWFQLFQVGDGQTKQGLYLSLIHI